MTGYIISCHIGNPPESLSQRVLVWRCLANRRGYRCAPARMGAASSRVLRARDYIIVYGIVSCQSISYYIVAYHIRLYVIGGGAVLVQTAAGLGARQSGAGHQAIGPAAPGASVDERTRQDVCFPTWFFRQARPNSDAKGPLGTPGPRASVARTGSCDIISYDWISLYRVRLCGRWLHAVAAGHSHVGLCGAGGPTVAENV